MNQEKNESFKYHELLNSGEPGERLAHLQQLVNRDGSGNRTGGQPAHYVNNHIHTTYSFSSYTPAMAVWMSRLAGLQVAGIMDHDTMRGAPEFMRAGDIAGIAVTKGVECRVDFSATKLKGRRINNPDQAGIAYIAIHGVPDCQAARVDGFFAPYREERNKRNRLMVEKLNAVLAPFAPALDFELDVLPLSQAASGGSVTERHILYSLACKLLSIIKKGKALVTFLQDEFGLSIPARNLAYLENTENPWYAYDLVNLLKSSLVEKFYIAAGTECPDVREVIGLACATGAIPAYAYLGDVAETAAEDKKAQPFEDAYLELLFAELKALGFQAVTYMPARNSPAQVKRVQDYCRQYDLFQICGEDINSPRQSFICERLKAGGMEHLVDAAWALVGHERLANNDPADGFCSLKTVNRYPHLADRTRAFRDAGKKGRLSV